MKNYGSWSGIAGLLSGVIAFLFSFMMTFLQKKFEYITTVIIGYFVGLLDSFSVSVLLIVTQLVSGVWYFWYQKRNRI